MKRIQIVLQAILVFSLIAGSASAAVKSVPSHYPTIQAAVDAAHPGDIVCVSATGSPYNESVTVSTPNITLFGNGNPVIDGTGLNLPGITINASGVTVQGFTVRFCHFLFGPVPGILVSDQSFSSTIIGNTVTNNDDGIDLVGLSSISPPSDQVNHTVQSNVVTNNTFFGISVFNLNGHTLVSQNTVSNNGFAGISSAFANGVSVTSNLVTDNGATGVFANGPDAAGILFETGGDPSLGTDPIYLNARPNSVLTNTISGSFGAGISVDQCVALTVNGNILTSNSLGIGLDTCVNVDVGFNIITDTAELGIFLQDSGVSCTGNTVHDNSVLNGQTDGIHVIELHGNTIGNILSQNTALGNAGYDAVDDSGKNRFKVQNTWINNIFGNSKPTGL